ncbi:MAG: dGTP triphosphohydrolase, partial [Pseudomonadota bacterium]
MPSPYASDPSASRGRLYPEPESINRSVFQRDRDRIIHSSAFRRLKYKTQVFVYHEGDNYRTRLTHSLEVAQIARSISRALGLNEDLAEAVSLAHDLGHTPFGHAGERALDKVMQPFGGFRHNDQTVRILTDLERSYADFDGLNLTWETIEGVIKHNGPVAAEKVPKVVSDLNEIWPMELTYQASLEAQIANLSDDIAYMNHDIDDGVRAGFFTLDELGELPFVGPIVRRVDDRYPDLETRRRKHEIIRRLVDQMVSDL